MGGYQASGNQFSQVKLQQALDASDLIGRWEYDVSNDRVYADALVALVFNIDPAATAAGASLDAFTAGVHPDDRDRFVQEIKRSKETGLPCTFEYRVCSADGVVRWVLDRGCIALDEAGRPLRGSGVLIDITQSRIGETESGSHQTCQEPHPLERAAEHCIAARQVIQDLPEPLLNLMSDMLLLELGRALAKLPSELRREAVN